MHTPQSSRPKLPTTWNHTACSGSDLYLHRRINLRNYDSIEKCHQPIGLVRFFQVILQKERDDVDVPFI